jgi:esterase
VKLHCREFGQGFPLIILHGLFGSSDNWQSIAKILSSNFRVILPDLRNHGLSAHSVDWTYLDMAKDIIELCEEKELKQIFLAGHSMGGKTAILVAGMRPDLVKKLIILDIGPGYYPPHHQKIFEAIDAANDTGLTSRKDAENSMKTVLEDQGIIQFLLKNLFWQSPEKLSWRFNLNVIRNNINMVGQANDLDNYPIKTHTLFLRGENSNYIKESELDFIRKKIPEVEFFTIKGAGHWLHADNPEDTLQIIKDWFKV